MGREGAGGQGGAPLLRRLAVEHALHLLQEGGPGHHLHLGRLALYLGHQGDLLHLALLPLKPRGGGRGLGER